MLLTSRIAAWRRAMDAQLSLRGEALLARLPALGVDESALLVVFALVIGAAVGAVVLVFYWLIGATQRVALSAAEGLTLQGGLSIMLVVVVGTAGARLLVRFGTDDSDGLNVPDIMRAVVKERGVVRATPAAVKTASTALLIGTTGAVGGEGPIAVAGSALGSRIGRSFRSGQSRLRVLIACGAAAGISAAFNAPIAGVFFSLEKVLGTFGATAFPPILVSSVIAAAISRAAFGNSPVIDIPHEYGLGAPDELLWYAALGAVAGVCAVTYTRTIYAVSDLLARLSTRTRQVLVASTIVAGLNMLFRADLWGRGHETLDIAIIGDRAWYFLLGLSFAKLLVTSFTVAAARCGGLFTPAMFIGATLGGGLATLGNQTLGLNVQPEAFALVGMAGVVAGATHAPLTAVMIVFEMTSDYALILPIMLSGAIAFITARRLYPDSVYSAWLTRRGEVIVHGKDEAVLERLRVSAYYDADPQVVGESATVGQILDAIGASPQTEFPVVDSDLRLVGMLTYSELRTVVSDPGRLEDIVVAGDIADLSMETVTPNDSMRTALQRLAVRDRHYLPVVAETDPSRLLGIISRQNILAAYDRALLVQTDDS